MIKDKKYFVFRLFSEEYISCSFEEIKSLKLNGDSYLLISNEKLYYNPYNVDFGFEEATCVSGKIKFMPNSVMKGFEAQIESESDLDFLKIPNFSLPSSKRKVEALFSRKKKYMIY